MNATESFFLRMITRGVVRVDDEGCVWRTAVLTRSGRVKRVAPYRAEQLRADGYSRVAVGYANRDVSIAAHRLVWLAAGRDIPDGYELNHRNGQRSDNRLSNLEAVTPGGNLAHAYAELGRWRAAGEGNGKHKLTWSDAANIRTRYASGDTKRGLAREFGVTPAMIRRIIAGTAWRPEYARGGAS